MKTIINVIDVNKTKHTNKLQAKNEKKFKTIRRRIIVFFLIFFCGKQGHCSYQCWYQKEEANALIEDLVATIWEASHMISKSEWWLENGATIHILKDNIFLRLMKSLMMELR